MNTQLLEEEYVRQDWLDSLDEELEQELDDGRLDALVEDEDGGMADLGRRFYYEELFRLQRELIKLQDWVATTKQKVVVIFEGRDAAGKGGVIKRITQRLNPRVCRVVALPAPSERERGQWYFQRYVPHLPGPGEIVLFDRSWYNRAGVALNGCAAAMPSRCSRRAVFRHRHPHGAGRRWMRHGTPLWQSLRCSQA